MTRATWRWTVAVVVLLLVAAAFAAAVGVITRTARSPAAGTPGSQDGLADLVRGYAASLGADAPYRPPSADERAGAVAALAALLDGRSPPAVGDLLAPLGFSLSTATDRTTGRGYVLVVNERPGDRAWGAYLVDTSVPVRLAVEVPHPNFDLRTEEIGLELYRRVPGSVLLIAGTHRRAAGGAGDVAHREDSMFQAVATELAARAVPQVQLHGFHDATLPDADVVISPGAGDAGQTVRRAAGRLADAGFAVCRSWREDCGRLEGTRNEQGRTAARLRTVFLHVEISRTVREDRALWAGLTGALAEVAGS